MRGKNGDRMKLLFLSFLYSSVDSVSHIIQVCLFFLLKILPFQVSQQNVAKSNEDAQESHDNQDTNNFYLLCCISYCKREVILASRYRHCAKLSKEGNRAGF